MKKTKSVSIILFTAILIFAGCASIVSKSEYPVNIRSQPEGAEISIKDSANNTVFTGRTPTIVDLKAGAGFFQGEDYSVTFEKEGYTPHTARIKRGVDGWYVAGNFFFGGLIGWLVVDPATGAMWTLDDLHVNLNVTDTSSVESGMQIVLVDDVPENLRKKMVRIN